MIEFSIPYPKPTINKRTGKKKTFGSQYGLNSIYAGKHYRERQADSTYWHTLVKSVLLKNSIPQQVFDCPVQITFLWDDNLDIDNHAYVGKMIVDAMKGYLIKDDTRKFYRRVIRDFHDGKCILVRIEEVR